MKASWIALVLAIFAGCGHYAAAYVEDSSPWGGPIKPPQMDLEGSYYSAIVSSDPEPLSDAERRRQVFEAFRRREAKQRNETAIRVAQRRRDELITSLNDYNVRACHLALPMEERGKFMPIAGYGTSKQTFVELDKVFNEGTAFESLIWFRPISRKQCPVIDALRKLSNQGLAVKDVELTQLDSNLLGFLQPNSEYIAIFHVSNSGTIRRIQDKDVQKSLFVFPNSKSYYNFKVELQPYEHADCPSNLVLAFLSARPLANLNLQKPTPTTKFLSRLLKEIRPRNDVTIAIGYARDKSTEQSCFNSNPNKTPAILLDRNLNPSGFKW